MSEDQFTKLFKYVEAFRKEMNERFEKTATQESLNRLTNTVDSFVKRLNTHEVEMAARDRQFDRLLEWARKVSEKTGIPLENL